MLGRFRADKGYDTVRYLPLFFRKSDESEPDGAIRRLEAPKGSQAVSSNAPTQVLALELFGARRWRIFRRLCGRFGHTC